MTSRLFISARSRPRWRGWWGSRWPLGLALLGLLALAAAPGWAWWIALAVTVAGAISAWHDGELREFVGLLVTLVVLLIVLQIIGVVVYVAVEAL